MYDFIIIGAGIAGITVAELLQRSNKQTLLLEAKEKVCSEASSQQAGWFHSGALYAALPNKSYSNSLIKNSVYLREYYSSFEGMNLNANTESAHNKWFSNNLVSFYFVSPSSKEVSYLLKLPWLIGIQIAKNRLLRSDSINKYDDLEAFAMKVKLGSPSLFLRSSDRTMNAKEIVTDLLRSYLGNGGKLITKSEVLGISKNHVFTSEEEYECKHIIIACGENNKQLVGIETKTVYSPIAVVYPSLTKYNFVRMTPDISKTVNHLCHRTGDIEYSVIGNASYYSEISDSAIDSSKKTFEQIMEQHFPDSDVRFSIYFGHKTEVVGKGQLRNYQSHIMRRDKSISIIPGKFSLAFSLAVNTCMQLGVNPCTAIQHLADYSEVEKYVSEPKHYQRAIELRDNQYA